MHPVYSGYRSSPSLLPCLADFIVDDFATSGILAWLRAWLYRGAQSVDIFLIFSSLDGTSCVRLKICCTAAPRLRIFSSLDGTSSVRLKLCCTAALRLLIFSSLDGSSSVRLKLCCIAAPRLLIFSSLDGTSSVRLKLCCTAAPRLLIFCSLYCSSNARPKLFYTQVQEPGGGGAAWALAPPIFGPKGRGPPTLDCRCRSFFLHVNLGPSQKIVGEIRGVFSFR